MTSNSPNAESTPRGAAKVRIYDLSRELGRDNRDILDVCDDLDIAYKSHSSTISGDDANRIREKLGAKGSTPDRDRDGERVAQKPAAPRSSQKPVAKPKPANHQSANVSKSDLQIVEVITQNEPQSSAGVQAPAPARPSVAKPVEKPVAPEAPKPAARASEPKPAAPAAAPRKAEAKPPTLSSPPPRPASTPSAPPVKPTAPARKASPAAPAASEGAVASPQQAAPTPPPPRAPAKPPQRPVGRPTSAPKPPSQAPQIVQPAAQTPKPKPVQKSPPIQLVGRPTPPPSPTKKGAPAPASKPVKPGAAAAESPSPAAPPKKKLPELVGPPIRANAVKQRKPGSEAGGDSTSTPDVPRLVEAPRRPSRNVPKRRQSSYEDDEMAALKQPLSRNNNAKRKRRRSPSGDDDNFEVEPTLLTAAKQAELDALKPLPRPGAKPPTSSPPLPRSTRKFKPSAPKRGGSPRNQPTRVVEEVEPVTLLEIEGDLTVQELADRLQLPSSEIVKTLFLKGLAVNLNQVLDIPTIEMVAQELDVEVLQKEEEAAAKKTEMLDLEDIEHLVSRPPVVTIMGHVDHGKTTLLDSIRESKVAEGEAGGITQHIGAYHVDLDVEGNSRRVVFLDTPGHEAFTAMRARGTKVTDIAVLVVAADDGVQPQTLEAISHARAAEVPIVVAVNKIDKEAANPDRVKQELAERGLMPEEWGGDTPMLGVSALAKQNLDELLEMLLLVAEVGELQANPDRPAKGTVIEANLDKARGPVATLLVQNGTLRIGDTVLAGSVLGRVKAMVDDRGYRIQEAGPSYAVEVLGMNDVPAAGDEFEVYPDERLARQTAQDRADDQRQSRLQQAMASRRVSLGTVSAKAQEGELRELNLLLKADVQGSVEAILGSLQQLPSEEVQVRVLLAAPGEISETDIDLAAASEAIIIGFNTTLAPGARQSADRNGVDVREYSIIYNLLEEITAAMEGLLEPEEVEEWMGQVEVRQPIQIGKGVVAGSYVQSGKVLRNSFARVKRGDKILYEGRIDSLKRFKDDVREVASGFECGISIDKYNGWEIGDIIEVYQLVAKRRTLATAR